MSKIEYTERGFVIFGELVDTYGATIRVQESSATGAPKFWIFANGGGTVRDNNEETATHI